MDAKECKEIIRRWEEANENAVKRSEAVRWCTDKYYPYSLLEMDAKARTYLAALNGPEVQALVSALERFQYILMQDEEVKDVIALRNYAQEALTKFRNETGER